LSRPPDKRPTAEEQARVSYPDIRDRLLSSSKEEEYTEWLVSVGRFVHHCWLREEEARGDGPLNEDATKHLWDECSESELEVLRTDAILRLENYRRQRLRTDLLGAVLPYLAVAKAWPARAALWVGKTMAEGFIGGVGLVVLGVLFLWLAPMVVKDIRGAADDVLPAATSPHGAAGNAVR
jgi:hypothetical protein